MNAHERAQAVEATVELTKATAALQQRDEQIAALKRQLAEAEAARCRIDKMLGEAMTERDAAYSRGLDEEHRAQAAMIIGAVGGFVDGAPTHSGNYLQRVRALVVERDEALKLAALDVARLTAERDAARRARDHFETALAEAQAHVAELRAALRDADDESGAHEEPTSPVRRILRAALSAPAGTEALRAFGLRVADACFAQASRSAVVDGTAAVDAVLRGES